ncbi:type 4 pilus major pilin [Komagataeibacter sp. SM21]|uniref:type 4 pilus major pilin n=1 Tax=Komagataeibacter sp. SM21 TaxID=3242899 RepID=UPI0035293773
MDTIVPIVVKVVTALLALAALLGLIYELFHKSSAETAAGYQSNLFTNIEGLYHGGMSAANYSDLSNSVAIKAAAVPHGMTNGDGSTITGPWPNSTVTLSSANGGAGWQALWTNVQSDGCASFVRSQAASNITVGGTTITPTDTSSTSEIANACNAIESGATTTIIFEYDG